MTQGVVRRGLSGSVVRGLVLLLVLALIGGCSRGGTAPEPTPTVEPTTTAPAPEPEPTGELPEEPVAPLPLTGTPDESDAEAAAEFFVRLYEYTLTTGDTAQWEARSMEGCGFCDTTSDEVAAHQEAMATYRGGVFVTEGTQFVAFDETLRMFAVEVAYTVASAELVDADGEVLQAFTAGEGFLLLEMGYSPETGWMLRTGGARQESVL